MARRAKIGVVAGGIDPLPAPAPGLVRLRAVDVPSLGLVAELTGHVIPSGYATLEMVDRRGKSPIIDFSGYPALTLKIPMLFDRWLSARSVEAEVQALEVMYGRRGAKRPATLTIEGFGVPHSNTANPDVRWVLSGDPEWDADNIRTRGSDGHRSYVPVTVTAVQYATPLTLLGSNEARRFYVVTRSGPRTLRAIARKFRVDWKILRVLNKGARAVPLDPDKAIKRGTKVRVA